MRPIGPIDTRDCAKLKYIQASCLSKCSMAAFKQHVQEFYIFTARNCSANCFDREYIGVLCLNIN